MKNPNFKFKISKILLRETKRNGGFTVLESIVAIAILSLSVSGAFSAVGQSLSQAILAKDEVKAFYLAQEAIEIIRNKRDSNQLASYNGGINNWLSGISQNAPNPCYFGKTCRTDAESFSLVDCGGGWDSCPNISQNATTFIYSYNGAYPVTNFKREIQIECVQNCPPLPGIPTEVAVTVKITWTKGSLPPMEFKVKEHLFDWI